MIPKVLTIAGSDSGGGAGIQADIKTFQELDVYGMSAITALTAQNTLGVQSVYSIPIDMILEQLASIHEDLRPDALKTGMLFSSFIIEAVSDKIKEYGWGNLVVDPVMIAKGGAMLLQEDAIKAIREKLLPLAKVTTPNIPEAEVLTEMTLDTMERRRKAAKILQSLGSESVVIKGGHGEGDTLIDLLYDGVSFIEFKSDRIHTRHTHGTGCTFAAAIASFLAKGQSVDIAVKNAKQFIQKAIENELGIGGGHGPTNHWAHRKASVSL
ncbi:bifunctional hydroxymethylpyrimidine kinase/phosphomethylpyrimidine kinase [Sutcliffiella rhizosphaerae]|uniref:Hydroxymethylpyrimidine/phosphomethylpyrimidine kinase n=1 Tax=Sutcliffiella rhizosphaerae TaxID=2880967 RepID=A0ABN8AHL5_9BACI|nr:bifunctional hydroxymethylpyrimidine kinase/phosphomethylpyrimidine kinase [Sutcliffiella rhizosphaerae]CAG9622583.1 Hydroxymethylpyrimidine/phosphomethylpyrimidine kinase [Sutcliffiella rhizosphaerae]